MHLSMVDQLVHLADDGGQSGGDTETIVTNGHDLQGREQSDNGGI